MTSPLTIASELRELWERKLTEAGLGMHAGERSDKLLYGCRYLGDCRRFNYTAPFLQDGATIKSASLRVSMLGNKNALGKTYSNRPRRPQTQATRLKIALAMKGNRNGGKPHTDEIRHKIALAMRGNQNGRKVLNVTTPPQQ